ncbi:hypothetical protein Dimus_024933 [Dionaea muscipula]
MCIAIDALWVITIRYQNLGEMMTLGRWDVAVSPSFIDGLSLEGPIGHAGKFIIEPSKIDFQSTVPASLCIIYHHIPLPCFMYSICHVLCSWAFCHLSYMNHMHL